MSLATLVDRFVEAARANPTTATDPRILDRLARAARARFADAVSPRPVMIATDRIEVATVLDRGSLAASARLPMIFSQPVEIVGFSCFVRPTFNPAEAAVTEIATAFDVLVSLDVNNQDIRTQQSQATAGGQPSQFVTLASLDQTLANALSGLTVRNARPNLGFTFRWKEALNVTPVPWKSALVTIVAHYSRLPGGTSE